MNFPRTFLNLMLLVAVFALPATRLQAAEEAPSVISGTVVSIVGDRLVISSQTETPDQKSEQIFMISPQTVYKNALSLNDLKRDDLVEVTYTQKADTRTATEVAKINKEDSRVRNTTQYEWDPSVKRED